MSARDKQKKKQRSSNVEELEELLYTWFLHMEAKRAPLTDLVTIEAAQRIGTKLELPANFRYSSKWLWDWKKRHAINVQVRHGEGDSADTVGIAIARADIPMLLADVDPDLIYNFDETGLLFRQLPKKSLASVHSKGRKGKKLAKDRITVGLFVNATGTDKFVPIVIGNAKSPHCFGRWKPADIDVQYYSNKTAWINGQVFVAVIHSFILHIAARANASTCNSKTYLVMDNATSYILPHDAAPWQSGQLKVFTLGNRVVIFLPANTTSTEQPLDSGIIKAFKAAFRRRHISWIVEQLELDDTDDVSKIKPNMKQAIEWVSYALKEVKVETVVNCWRKAGILPPRETEMDEIDTGISTEDTELLEELSTVVNQMAKTVNVAGESFLSPDKLLDLPIEREIEDNPIDDALHEVQQDPDVDVVEEIEEDPVDNIEPPIITLRDARCHTIFEPFPLSYLRT